MRQSQAKREAMEKHAGYISNELFASCSVEKVLPNSAATDISKSSLPGSCPMLCVLSAAESLQIEDRSSKQLP